MPTRAETDNLERFADRFGLCCSPARREIEYDTLGASYGSTGFTTRAQADHIAAFLRLGPGTRVADIGVGSGWPGIHFAATTGCTVVGTDLPVAGLGLAVERAAADSVTGVHVVAATGRCQPLRSAVFDAVVHSDVLCCLAPKESVLRECRRLLRPGGRLAFLTIHVAPGLHGPPCQRAVRAGPPQVAARRPYPEMVERAGFSNIRVLDMTEDYERAQRSWYEGIEVHADAFRALMSDRELEVAQADRRLAIDAIGDGLLRRSMITATC